MPPSLRVRLSFKIQIQFAEPNNRLNFFFPSTVDATDALCSDHTAAAEQKKSAKGAFSLRQLFSLLCDCNTIDIEQEEIFIE